MTALGKLARASTWKRIPDGYERGSVQIFDNGAGVGPSKGSGRWALMVDGHWIDNIDTLAEAKTKADEVQA